MGHRAVTVRGERVEVQGWASDGFSLIPARCAAETRFAFCPDLFPCPFPST